METTCAEPPGSSGYRLTLLQKAFCEVHGRPIESQEAGAIARDTAAFAQTMNALTGAAHCDTSQCQEAILVRIRVLEERRERLASPDLFAPPSALRHADDRDPTDPAEILYWEQYAVDAQLERLFDTVDPRALAQYRRHEVQSPPKPDFYV